MRLSLNLGLGAGVGSAFSPASLFAAGESGYWLDPSDFTTMFQDTAGATPVTAVGQSVRLMLDKSKGLVLGPELVTNGDFSSGSTGWTLAASATVTGGALSVNSVTTENFCVSTGTIPATSRTYLVTFDVTRTSGAFSVFVGQVAAANQLFGAQINTSGSRRGYVLYGLPGGASNTIIFRAEGGFVGSIDNISVRELPGNHFTQANVANAPILGREPFGGRRNLLTYTEDLTNAVWTLIGTGTTITASGVGPSGQPAFSLVAGATSSVHQLRYNPTASAFQTVQIIAKANGYDYLDIVPNGLGTNRARFNLATGEAIVAVGGNILAGSITALGDSWYLCTVTYALGSTDLRLGGRPDSATGSFTGDGVSGVLLCAPQVETGSTATAYQRVVTAFDVTEAGVADCYYLSFDGTDDWLQSAATINPGAVDKAQVFAGVRKLSDAAIGEVVGSSTAPAGLNGSFFIRAPTGVAQASYQFRSRGTTTNGAGYTNAAVAAPITNVLTGLADISGPSEALRVNGVVVASNTLTQGTGNYLTYTHYIGRTGGTSNPYNGRVYQMVMRFGANLTAGQITQTETFVNSKTGAY